MSILDNSKNINDKGLSKEKVQQVIDSLKNSASSSLALNLACNKTFKIYKSFPKLKNVVDYNIYMRSKLVRFGTLFDCIDPKNLCLAWSVHTNYKHIKTQRHIFAMKKIFNNWYCKSSKRKLYACLLNFMRLLIV